MAPIRVLVVDDAVVVRRIVTEALAADTGIEVVGSAPNGRVALAKLPQLAPDLVTLDIEMPELDGLQTLRELRRTYPKLPVIMFSTLTARGASATLDALAAGASDYVTKPSNVGSVIAAQQRVRDELIPRIYTLCGRTPSRPTAATRTFTQGASVVPAVGGQGAGARDGGVTGVPGVTAGASGQRSLWKERGTGPFEAVVVGVSTGGPNALAEILPRLSRQFVVPIVIVQHMPPLFTRLLATRLDAESELSITEAANGQCLAPGCAYIAPGDYHVEVRRVRGLLQLATHQGPPENSCRPAVDVLFRSAARTCGDRVLAVVLTGMGQDGLRGCASIVESGGEVVAQDRESSVVWGMPGFVANAGLANRVVPLAQMAGEIMSRVAQRSNGRVPPAWRSDVGRADGW